MFDGRESLSDSTPTDFGTVGLRQMMRSVPANSEGNFPELTPWLQRKPTASPVAWALSADRAVQFPSQDYVGSTAVSESRKHGPNILQTLGSVLMAFLGVQSHANRERDFTKGRAGVFIAVGLVMTLLLMMTLYSIVQMVLPE